MTVTRAIKAAFDMRTFIREQTRDFIARKPQFEMHRLLFTRGVLKQRVEGNVLAMRPRAKTSKISVGIDGIGSHRHRK